MNGSTPGLPVQLPEFTQTHVHRVSDAIQPSHPLSSPSPIVPNPSQHQSHFQWVLFAWGGQSTGVSALASFLPKKSQGWSPLEWTGWFSLQSLDLLPKVNFLYNIGSSNPVLCENLEVWDGVWGGKEVQEEGDLCIPVADSCWCMAETNTIL